jgi:hypothetical protein
MDEPEDEVLEAMVDAYNTVQSPADRGYAQQEMGMQAALQVYLDNAAQLPASAPAVSVDEGLLSALIAMVERFERVDATGDSKRVTAQACAAIQRAEASKLHDTSEPTRCDDGGVCGVGGYCEDRANCGGVHRKQPSGELGKSAEQEKT